MKPQTLLLVLVCLVLATACGAQEVAQAAPAVWLDRPLDGSQHPLAPLAVQVHARPEPGGQIIEVQLWVNGELTQRMTNPELAAPLVNLEQTWTPPSNGEFLLEVRAVNAASASSPPAAARVRIGQATPLPSATAPLPAETPTPTDTSTVPPPGTGTPTSTFTSTPSPTLTPTGTPPPVTDTPTSTPTATPTDTLVPTPTFTFTPTPSPQISFRVDDENLAAGECTTLRWDVENVREVYIEGIGGPGHGSQQICPEQTTTYTMRVVLLDGGEEFRTVTVSVSQPADTQPPIIGRTTVRPTEVWDNSACGPAQATFTAMVTDNSSVASVVLWYRLKSGDWQTASMSLTSTATYQITLDAPPVSNQEKVEWFVQAQDTVGNTAKSSVGTILVRHCVIVY
jgi:hypothetical protein